MCCAWLATTKGMYLYLHQQSTDTRKQGVDINKIARKLGIGVSVVQRVVSAN
jgi:hypothetical protein